MELRAPAHSGSHGRTYGRTGHVEQVAVVFGSVSVVVQPHEPTHEWAVTLHDTSPPCGPLDTVTDFGNQRTVCPATAAAPASVADRSS